MLSFPPKTPIFGHIPEVSFDRNSIKKYRHSYFYNRKSNCVFRFSVKPPNIRENRIKMSICVNFRRKVRKKWCAKKNLSVVTRVL